MTFDLRIAIGALFLLCGLIIGLHGLLVGTLVQGINVNLYWGGVLVLFGLATAYLGGRRRSR